MRTNSKSQLEALYAQPDLQAFVKELEALPLQRQWHTLNTFVEELAPEHVRWADCELSETELADEIDVLSRLLGQLLADLPEARRAQLATEYAVELRDSEAWDEAAANPKALDALGAQLDEALAEGSTRPLFPNS